MRQRAPILVAGGGIGGLSAGIALAQAGFYVHILERTSTFSSVGAGIQLGPNAARILDRWGVSQHFIEQSVRPEQVSINDGMTGQNLVHVPLGNHAEQRYGAPYYVLHRADLQSALLKVALNEPHIEISTESPVISFRQYARGVSLVFEDGRTVEGAALIGADGIWSSVRAQIHNSKPAFIGKTSWRTVIPSDYIPDLFKKQTTCLWMGPNAHLVHYPVLGGKAVNVVAIVNDKTIRTGWDISGNKEEMLPHFKRWHHTPRTFMQSLSGWSKWSLFALPPLKTWGQGLVTLLGDAAHPPVPFLAQGGAMAIEDAAVLASELLIAQGHYSEAFRHYEDKRKPRVERVMRQSHRMGRVYHLPAPFRQARNAVLKRSQPGKLLKQYDWLYGFDSTAD